LIALLIGCAPTKPVKSFEFPPTPSKARIKFYDDANRISATLSMSDVSRRRRTLLHDSRPALVEVLR
jgi:hypothetical protein